MRFSDPMNDLIQVRVSRTEKRRLKDFARQQGMTLSDFLRETATEAARQMAA